MSQPNFTWEQPFHRHEALRDTFIQLCSQASSVLESETLEIKNWCADEKQLGEKAAEVAVCLANLRGGMLLVGIENEDLRRPKFSACPHQNVTAEWLRQRIQDNTVPPVHVSVVDATPMLQEVTGDYHVGCLAVFVEKSRFPGGHQTRSGLAKIRSGKECRPYYVAAQDDRTRATVPYATIDELSSDSIEWGMRQHAKRFGTSKVSWEGTTDFLLHTSLVESIVVDGERLPRFNVSLAAMLLFGTESALVREFPGFETLLITPAGTTRLRNNIVETYKYLCGSRSAVLPSLYRLVPINCIKELLVNAFIHRSYRHTGPITIRATESILEFDSPGGLSGGLTVESLLYCTPAYRNFLLAEGGRYLGLCDKIGKGIDEVYEGVLQSGLGFPIFENFDSNFKARISLDGCREFQEFVKQRAQSLTLLDEIIVLRYLFERDQAGFRELCAVMQRGNQFGHKILSDMCQKNMIESVNGLNLHWRLTPILRNDIRSAFLKDQYRLGFDLFGES